MEYVDAKRRVLAAQKILETDSTSREKIESLRTLLSGVNPSLDKILNDVTTTWSKVHRLQGGEIIELTTEAIPEDTEERKKKKKALLLFIRSWKSLKSEVERIQKEFDNQKTNQNQAMRVGRIIAQAKGPFGLITAVAIIAVVALSLMKSKTPTQTAPTSAVQKKIQVITFNGKQIPLTEVYIGTGPDCDSPHYHAKDHTSAKSIDGSVIVDPGGCGFGRVKEVKVEEVVM